MANLVTEILHKFKFFRVFAKKAYRYKTIRQPFYGGAIFFNAVDFSFLWTNLASAEKHDRAVQDTLLQLSMNKNIFIDIGANIGIMTLSIALRNKNIAIKSYDPNSSILNFLRRSLEYNNLKHRVQLVNAAVSDYEGSAFMDFSKGSYAGHLSSQGTEVKVEHFNTILVDLQGTPALFKLDVEGFETKLIPILAARKNPLHVFVIEMHPPKFNGISNPEKNLSILLSNGFIVTSVNGNSINNCSQIDNWENVVCWYEKK